MTEKSHRTGYYDARDGRGWQPCVSTLSVEAGLARDAAAKEAQRLHREARAAELRAQADALDPRVPDPDEVPHTYTFHCDINGRSLP